MKKVLLAILLMIITTTSLFALSNFYMAPYGATMVNLDAPEEWKTERDTDSQRDNADGGVFPDLQRVLIGGIEDLKIDGVLSYIFGTTEFQRYGISLSFNSINYDKKTHYFWFTKQSDPEFRRPFQIQIVERVFQEGLGSQSYYQSLGMMGESGTETLEADSIRGFENIVEEIIGGITGRDVSYNVAFEFGIILPGEINNGILTLDDGSTYPIASGTDYSAEIEVTASLVDMQNNNRLVQGPYTFVITIGGYYDPRYPDGTGSDNFDTSASLYVTPYARAANINIRDDQGTGQIPIAGVDFAIYDLPDTWTDGQYDDSAFIFLSASSNPFVQDTRGFRFVHESVGFGDAELPTNSIGYTITAVPDSAGGESVTFDGTDYMTVTELPENKITTDHNDMTLGSLFGGGTAHWHSWNGELMLTLDTNNRMMNEGLYRSTVYVHVVTNDSLDQGGTA